MLGPVVQCGVIEGEVLRLVPTRERHLADCIRWFENPEVTRYLTALFPFSAAGEEKWYEGVTTDPSRVNWAIELGDVHIGQTGVEGIDWITRTGTTGIMIGETQYWRKGIASAVMRARSAYAFRSLNLTALYTEIFTTNTGSLKAAAKAGYREYGRRPYAKLVDGEYLTSWLAVLARDEWEAGQA